MTEPTALREPAPRHVEAARQILAWARLSGCPGCDLCRHAEEILAEAAPPKPKGPPNIVWTDHPVPAWLRWLL